MNTVLPLLPHAAKPQTFFIETPVVPTILISSSAYRDIQYLIEASKENEIGWLGTATTSDNVHYLIDKIFLFHQEAGPVHCDLDAKDVARFWRESRVDPANRAMLDSILFWGHLHPGDMTSPSSQDDAQMNLFSDSPYFIRGIFTRIGKCVFTFYDYKKNMRIIDCPWTVYPDMTHDSAKKAIIQAEVALKVRKHGAYIPTLPDQGWQGMSTEERGVYGDK